MKKAPYLNKQDRNYLNDMIVLAGSQAFNPEVKSRVLDWAKLPYDLQPVTLGVDELENDLPDIQIVHKKQRRVRLYQAGSISQTEIEGIIYSLAMYSEVENLVFFDEIMKPEDLSNRVKQVRAGESEVNKVIIEKQRKENKNINLEKLAEREQAKAFIESVGLLRSCPYSGNVYAFDGLKWDLLPTKTIKSKIAKFFSDRQASITINRLNKLVEWVGLEVGDMVENNGRYIGFLNGVLDKSTGDFLQHDESYCLKNIEPLEVDLSLETPTFNKWLDFVSNKNQDKKEAVLAGLYMILTNRYDWSLFLEVVGKAGSGKSVFCNIARMINGDEFSEVFNMDSIGKMEYRSGLVGKTLAYAPDHPPYKGSGDDLKALTSGEGATLEVRQLYKERYSYLFRLVFLIVTNHCFSFTDRECGIERRRVIIEFDRAVKAQDRDTRLTSKLKKEVYGIVNLLLSRFNNDPLEARDILEKWKDSESSLKIKARGNSLAEFASYLKVNDLSNKTGKERLDLFNGLRYGSAMDKSSPPQTIYGGYIEFCKYQGLNPLPLKSIKEGLPTALKSSGQNAEIEHRIKQGRTITNIEWAKPISLILQEWKG